MCPQKLSSNYKVSDFIFVGGYNLEPFLFQQQCFDNLSLFARCSLKMSEENKDGTAEDEEVLTGLTALKRVFF